MRVGSAGDGVSGCSDPLPSVAGTGETVDGAEGLVRAGSLAEGSVGRAAFGSLSSVSFTVVCTIIEA